MKNLVKSAVGLVGLGIFLSVAGVALAGYGDSAPTPTCGGDKPDQPVAWVARTGSGWADLSWGGVNHVSSWTVAYGYSSGQYIYGMSGFGDANYRGVRINSLPGGKYYFVVRANNGCMPGPFSNEMTAMVGGGGGGYTTYPALPAPQPLVTGRKAVVPAPTPAVTPKLSVPSVNPSAPAVKPVIPRPQPVSAAAPQTPPNFFQAILNFFSSLFKR